MLETTACSRGPISHSPLLEKGENLQRRALVARRYFLVGSLLALLVLGACQAPPPEAESLALTGSTMGTTYMVKVVDVAGSQLEAQRETLSAAIERALDDVDARMSTWREDSELSRFNRHGEELFELSIETTEVLRNALDIHQRSSGALDVTIKPLLDAWGFSSWEEPPEPPDDATRATLRERIGSDKLVLMDGAVVKQRPDVIVDLSAIAKGYAVDRVAEAVETMGVTRFMVEVGGEIRAAGRNAEGNLWRIGVERPESVRGTVQRIVVLDHRSIATSGDYRNYREVDGERIAHIFDPRSGEPVRHKLASVSVVHPSCMLADAWATALLVLGPEEGLATAEREGLAALFLVREGDGFREVQSSAFQALLAEQPS